MTKRTACLGCGAREVEMLVNFGHQPPSNRYERADQPPAETHPLVVGQCRACALIQLVNPMPPKMAKSRFEWLTYNEPEGHLDDLVDKLGRLHGVARDARVVGVTYKDDTTLARLGRLGFGNTYRYEMVADLGLDDPCASLESIQEAFIPERTRQIAARHGTADLLIARHILEHAHAPAAFVGALRALVRPGGWIVFEMPDCTKFVRARDYSFFWEEHICYFCADTLRAFLQHTGVALESEHLYPYPLEDSLIAVVRNSPPLAGSPLARASAPALGDGDALAGRFAETGEALRQQLGRWRREGKRVAIFGAGHLAAKFVNFFGLAGLLECVIDDNPHKQALLMPGSRLPILPSSTLLSRPIDLCLLSLSPESEQKVLAKNRDFVDKGGRFLSIFALSPNSVHKALAA